VEPWPTPCARFARKSETVISTYWARPKRQRTPVMSCRTPFNSITWSDHR
jgi:hypothetical protein